MDTRSSTRLLAAAARDKSRQPSEVNTDLIIDMAVQNQPAATVQGGSFPMYFQSTSSMATR